LAGGPLGAQTANDSSGLGTSWLKISPSSRNAAMGDSTAAAPDPFDAVNLNPAGLGMAEGGNLSFSQNFWAQGLSAQHLVYSQGLPGGDGFSVGANAVNFGSIDTYNVTGSVLKPTGSYSPMGLNVYGGYGWNLGEGLRAGLAGRVIYDDVQQNAPDKTASLDGGLYYRFSGSPLSLAAVLSDVGWNIDNATLPLELKTAAAYPIAFGASGKDKSLVTLTAEADWFLNDMNYTQASFGVVYLYANSLALRAGYQFSNIGDLTGLAGLSLGAGIEYSNWQLDYALVTLGELGVANQIGLSVKLGGS
jgi:hypothetical protein